MTNKFLPDAQPANEFRAEIGAADVSPMRQHSLRMVAAIQSWAASIDVNDAEPVTPLLATWCELLRAVAGEGSFLGFPRISKLCRVLHAALENQIERQQSLTLQQHQTVHQVAKALADLAVDPRSQLVNTAGLVQQLRLAFDLTENDLAKAIPHINYLQDTELKREGVGASHRDLDVYLSARLDTLDRCYEEESWIVTQLASLAEDLASGMQSQRPASRLTTVLRSHKFFHQVDRVCLAGRVPNSNQLMVVDSAFSDRCESNILKPGYSCFVNPEGSLFNMRPGTMRIFDDSQRVLDSFAASGKPAQRSIALIGDMGLRSGLCLAIGRESELQGFLFLNSCQPELFRDITIRFAPLISLLGLVATIALDSNGFHKSFSRQHQLDHDLPKSSMLFDAGEFQSFMFRALQRRLGQGLRAIVAADMHQDMDDFLYLPAQVCGTLAELAMRLQLVKPDSCNLSVRIAHEGAMITFGMTHHCDQNSPAQWGWMREQVDCIASSLGNTPVKLSTREDQVLLETPFEPVLQSHRGLRYSVVY